MKRHEAALAYARVYGWHVFAVRRNSKLPVGKWKGLASNAPAAIRQQWEHEQHNVGVATGARSGLFVLDVDGDEGRASLRALEAEHGPLPSTLTARTASGGLHLYWRHPGGHVPNSASKLGPHLDVRGDGGYVLAPPSVLDGGRRYSWPDEGVPVAEAPAWLVELAASGPAPSTPTPARASGRQAADPLSVRERAYLADALQAEVERVRSAAPGTRNSALNEAAYNLGQLVPHGLDEALARDALSGAAAAVGLEPGETAATIDSGIEKGKLNPRGDRLPEMREDEADDVLQEVRRRFLVSAEQPRDFLSGLRSDADIAALSDPEYVVDRWVPRGVYTVLYGEPGVGKTFLLLGMFKAVRRGKRWQSYPTLQGLGLFFEGEGLEQLKPRLHAWDSRYPLARGEEWEGEYQTDSLDLTKPEGVAAVIRTVQGYEAKHGQKVTLLCFDPLVEFMTGEENGEGMEKVSRGLRVLADFLNIGVIAGHHSNASGARARGSEHLRMRAGAMLRAERLPDGRLGVLQEKQKNAQQLGMVLEEVEHEGSLVLEHREHMVAADYIAQREGGKKRATEARKEGKADDAADEKRRALLSYVEQNPDCSVADVKRALGGRAAAVNALIDELTDDYLSVEGGGPGKPKRLRLMRESAGATA